MKENILAISGKSGLYKLVARGGNTIIVESVDAQKHRFNVGLRDRVTSLNDVSIYTTGDDVKLLDIYASMLEQQGGKRVEIDLKHASKADLAEAMARFVPDYDRDRVYPNDMKKLIQWYNILVDNGITDFKEEAASNDAEAETKEPAAETKDSAAETKESAAETK